MRARASSTGETAITHESLDLHVEWNVDDDLALQIVARVLGEQWYVEHDDLVGRNERGDCGD